MPSSALVLTHRPGRPFVDALGFYNPHLAASVNPLRGKNARKVLILFKLLATALKDSSFAGLPFFESPPVSRPPKQRCGGFKKQDDNMTTITKTRPTTKKQLKRLDTLFRIAHARGERARNKPKRVLKTHNQDCLAGMQMLDTNSVSACITDPPYGIDIAKWDGKVPSVEIWKEVLRVLKPGAFCVAAAAPRTAYQTARALEEAGFEIVDTIVWHYTQSFPGAYGVEGEWRSNLKTNHEPFVVARKPLEAGLSLSENWQIWGTGCVRTGAAGDGNWRTNVISVPKPSDEDRDLGAWFHCEPVPLPPVKSSGARSCSNKHLNTHPTVKPLTLMRTLVRLFTPDNGLVLDPFTGSGSTGVAAAAEGHSFVGYELDPGYAKLAYSRTIYAAVFCNEVPEALF